MKTWKLEELQEAIRLLKQGFNYEQISIKLGRSWYSVRNKLQEHGYSYNEIKKETRKCLNCNNKFKVSKNNDKKLCGISCRASYTNKNRTKKDYGNCLNCNKKLNRKKSKYCSNNCQGQLKRKQIFLEIENGSLKYYESEYKKFLILKCGEQCMECGWNVKNIYTNKVPIQLEHIDGNSENNKLDNLKLLCPNCHSLTKTWGGGNKGNGRKKRQEKRNEEKLSSSGLIGKPPHLG